MKLKREVFFCVLTAAVSLVAAAACHRFAPGFGAMFKPLLWPLAVLPFAVRPRLALTTAFAVPLLSCAVNGMPALPIAMSLSALALAYAAVVGIVCRLARRPAAKGI